MSVIVWIVLALIGGLVASRILGRRDRSLTGTVRSQSDRLTALTLARSTDGVRSVIGDLTLKAQ